MDELQLYRFFLESPLKGKKVIELAAKNVQEAEDKFFAKYPTADLDYFTPVDD